MFYNINVPSHLELTPCLVLIVTYFLFEMMIRLTLLCPSGDLFYISQNINLFCIISKGSHWLNLVFYITG